MDVFLTVEEVANLLGISLRAVQKNVANQKYLIREAKSKGGKGGIRNEISLESLPEQAQETWRKQQANKAIEALPEPIKELVKAEEKPQLPAVKKPMSQYTEKQRDVDLAINVLMRWISNYPGKVTKAIAALNAGYEHGLLDAPIISALERSRIKKSGNAQHTNKIITLSTYEKWLIRHREQGNYVPQIRGKDMSVQPWYETAIALYRRPQKPTIEWVTEQLASSFAPAPSYWAVRRFFVDKFSAGELEKGRSTGMQLRAKQHHKTRTTDGMLPWQEVHADGWKTHFTAPHPVTGEFVSFEIWDFHDVATRYVPPFAIGMTENYETIAKGVENAIRDQGVMGILQTDSTKIIKKNTKFVGNPVLSISERAGITIVHPKTVGNAQANGIAENFHAWMDKQSRELATYQGKKMDSLAFKRTQKLTAKLAKARASNDQKSIISASQSLAKVSNGIIFESFEHACAWLEEKRQKWNHHAHSSLKKIKDPITGRSRHQTPQECLDEFKAQGWQPHHMGEDQIIDLFRPRVQCRVVRGVVKPYGKMRFRHDQLDHYEGQNVVVAYDIMEYSHVWVTDFTGSLICIAEMDASCAYRSQTAYDAAQEKREQAQIKRRENQIATIQARSDRQDKVIESTARTIYDDIPFIDIEPEAQPAAIDIWSHPEEKEEPRKLTHEETVQLLWGYTEEDEKTGESDE